MIYFRHTKIVTQQRILLFFIHVQIFFVVVVANFSPVRQFFSLRFLSLSIDYSEFYLPH